MVIAVLALMGLALGSFVNATVWRLHEQAKSKSKKSAKDLSILKGRSMCPDCRHHLDVTDLIPVVSWLLLRGKCHYCKKPISWQYPVVEISGVLLFTLSYIYWPGGVHSVSQWLQLATWLVCSVGLMALLVYDARWMLLPNRLIYPTLAATVVGRTTYLLAYEDNKLHALLNWGLALVITSGLFWLIYQLSAGKWIGFGDVRLGFITGTLLMMPGKALLMIFLASILGVIYALPSLFSHSRAMTSKLPYGPFLIFATWLCVLFGQSLLDWYSRQLF